MSTRDLINAIAAGDAIEIENAFNSVMAEKVSARIDDMRIDVAQNLFAEQAEEIEEEPQLNLEDYSLEEIEAYMQTEEFEQLDELKRSTLQSYVNKARNDKQEKDDTWTSVPMGATGGEKASGDKAYHKSKQREKGMELAKGKLSTAKVRATD